MDSRSVLASRIVRCSYSQGVQESVFIELYLGTRKLLECKILNNSSQSFFGPYPQTLAVRAPHYTRCQDTSRVHSFLNIFSVIFLILQNHYWLSPCYLYNSWLIPGSGDTAQRNFGMNCLKSCILAISWYLSIIL
jgi:hypothetical protein